MNLVLTKATRASRGIARAVTTANTAAGRAQGQFLDATRTPFDTEARAAMQAFLADARAWFPPTGSLSVDAARRQGLLSQMRQRIDALTQQCAHRYVTSALDSRRHAYVLGLAAQRLAMRHAGAPPTVKAAHKAVVASNRGLGVRIGDRQVLVEAGFDELIAGRRVEIDIDEEGGSLHEVAGRSVELTDVPPIDEPAVQVVEGKRRVSRVIIQEPDGSIWTVFDPKDKHVTAPMFPGGGVEEGETFQEAAVRECMEECGLIIELVQWLADFEDEHAFRRYYLGRRIAPSQREAEWDPSAHPREPSGSPEGGEFASQGGGTPAPAPPPARGRWAGEPGEQYARRA